MLQRIQTVYLLIALALVASSSALPWVTYLQEGASTQFMVGQNALAVYALAAATCFTIIAATLAFKDRKRQMLLIKVAMVDAVLLLGIFSVLHYLQINALSATGALELAYGFGPVLPIVSLILLWMAHKGVKKDDDLVRSVDRLR